MITQKQFIRNLGIVTPEEQKKLSSSTVIVVGLGCTGSAVVEFLARTGVGGFILVDGDYYDETNINRQLNALHSTIGKPKVEATAGRILDINPCANVTIYHEFISVENASTFMRGASLVISGVDDTFAMVILHRTAKHLGLPCIMVLGGCIPFHGALTTFFPDSPVDYETLMNIPTRGRELSPRNKEELFKEIALKRAFSGVKRGAHPEPWLNERINGGPVPSFATASNITGIIAAHEAVKLLIQRKELQAVSSPDLLFYDGVRNEMKVLHPSNGNYWDQRNF
ncbi:MAG: ThiF family adenylyltransferase [Ignavibacteriae bacterium]|nr:ThiF family adenylyltransferase [Ignavibacteriota bacterium]